MEKRGRREQGGSVQEGLEIQDSGIFPEQRASSNDLHSSQQLPNSEGSARNESCELRATYETRKLVHQDKEETENNISKRDSMEKTEASGSSSQKCRKLAEYVGLKQGTVEECIPRQKVEKSVKCPLSGAQDTTQQESDQGTLQKRSVFAEDEQLDPERNRSLQRRAESSGKILITHARDSIQAWESGSNDVEQECDGNAHLAESTAVQRKSETLTKPLILSSKSDHACIESKENGEVSERQRIATHQENSAPEVSSAIRAELRVRIEETSVRKQQLLKLLSNLLNQRQQEINEQQVQFSHNQNIQSFSNSKEKYPLKLGDTTTTGESEGNRNGTTQDLEGNVTDCHSQSGDGVLAISLNSIDTSFVRHLETKADTKLKYDITSLVNDTDFPKSSKSFVTFERRQSEVFDGSSPPSVSAALEQKSETPTKPLSLSSKLKQACKVLEENVEVKEGQQREIVPHQASLVLEDFLAIRAESGAKEEERSVREQQWLKVVSNFFNQQQMEILHQGNKHSFDSLDEIESQKLEDPTTTGESIDNGNACVCPRDLEENMTGCQNVNSLLQNTKVYTIRSFPFNSQDDTVCPPKTKDYVTDLPRESDHATTRFQNAKDLETSIAHTSNDNKSPFSQWKNYVTVHSSDQKKNARMPPRPLPETTEPRTHVSMHVRPIPGIERIQKYPTRVFWPLTRFHENADFPKQEGLGHDPISTQQLEEEKRNILFPNSCRTRSNQAQFLQCQRLHPVPDDDNLPLMPFQERPETAVETEEPRVQRNGEISATLLHPLQTGIRDYIQRIREHHISSERHCFCGELKKGCFVFFCSAIIGCVLVIVLYFVIVNAGVSF